MAYAPSTHYSNKTRPTATQTCITNANDCCRPAVHFCQPDPSHVAGCNYLGLAISHAQVQQFVQCHLRLFAALALSQGDEPMDLEMVVSYQLMGLRLRCPNNMPATCNEGKPYAPSFQPSYHISCTSTTAPLSYCIKHLSTPHTKPGPQKNTVL